MTEQDFRRRLHEALSAADFADERKRHILIQMEGGEPQMKTIWHRRRIIILCVLGVLLLTTVTAIASGGWRVVDLQGEKQDTSQFISVGQNVNQAATLLGQLPDGVLGYVTFPPDEVLHMSDMFGNIRYRPDTLEQAEQRVRADEVFPWPQWLPEGYQLIGAWFDYSPTLDATYTVSKPTKPMEGFTLIEVQVPAETQQLNAYRLRLENRRGQQVELYLYLSNAQNATAFLDEDETARSVTCPGMDHALLITSPDQIKLEAQTALPTPQTLESPRWISGTKVVTGTATYKTLRYYLKSDGLTEQELLAIFGLE